MLHLATDRMGAEIAGLLEQTLQQADGFQISLLFVRLEETENEEEETEITKSWGSIPATMSCCIVKQPRRP